MSSTVAWSQALEAVVLRRQPPLVSLHSCSGVFFCIHCSNADVNRKCTLDVVGYDAAEMIEPEVEPTEPPQLDAVVSRVFLKLHS